MTINTGIYVHIPFCLKKCNYCDFISISNYDLVEKYFEKLILEIENRGNKDKIIKTIYFGGGTPSSVETKYLKMVVSALKNNFDLSRLEEMTLELNPGTSDRQKMIEYREMGFNRLSVGVQSFDEKMLQLLGRIHNRLEVYNTINLAKNAGFENISIDLMYGLPKDSIARLQKDLNLAVEMRIQHISTYGLIVEPGTKFFDDAKVGLLKLPDEDIILNMRKLINRILDENGYIHYEIANYSKEGFESKHNHIYWENDDYYGFGLDSTTKINNIRYKNESDIVKYIENYDIDKFDLEELTDKMILEEGIFLGLRLLKGIDLDVFYNRYNIDIKKKYVKVLDELLQIKAIRLDDKNLSLTDYGIEISNYCLAKFLL